MKRLVVVITTLLLAASATADDGKPPSTGLAFFANAGGFWADKATANFYNGRPFLFGLWRLTPGTKELELRILPLQKDMPVYFPREADVRTAGEEVRYVTIQPRP